jgi:hypothetical protein
MTAAAPILIFHKAGAIILEPGSWILTPAGPPSAHPFSRASAGARAPVLGEAPLWGEALGASRWGLVAQLVRARA